MALLTVAFFWWRADRQETSTATTRPVAINMATFSKALGNLPYHVARHFKWFESAPGLENATFTYGEFNDRPSISNAFSSGDLQVLFSADIPSIICRAQGNDISAATLTTVVTQNVLVRSDLPFRTLEELKGKRIAVLQGTSSHYCLLKVLKDHGLKESDFDLRYMPAPEAKVAFETGAIDAWAVWAPFVEQQEVTGIGRLVEGADATINSLMTVSRPFITQHFDEAKALVAVIQRAKEWIRQNPAEAQSIASKELGLDSAVVAQAWPKHDWGTGLTEAVLDDLQEKANFLAEADKARARIDVRSGYVDLRFTPHKID
ncbi:MAG: ABC transporter substrate-binding protein [Prosthecobacter sp.]|nr:ABC transporter substrate-binding protein [Prosthecobacter sp.]